MALPSESYAGTYGPVEIIKAVIWSTRELFPKKNGPGSIRPLAQLKALSQNLMHSNISITDGIYGMLSNTDKKKLLSDFNPEQVEQSYDLNQKIDEILNLLKRNI